MRLDFPLSALWGFCTQEYTRKSLKRYARLKNDIEIIRNSPKYGFDQPCSKYFQCSIRFFSACCGLREYSRMRVLVWQVVTGRPCPVKRSFASATNPVRRIASWVLGALDHPGSMAHGTPRRLSSHSSPWGTWCQYFDFVEEFLFCLVSFEYAFRIYMALCSLT